MWRSESPRLQKASTRKGARQATWGQHLASQSLTPPCTTRARTHANVRMRDFTIGHVRTSLLKFYSNSSNTPAGVLILECDNRRNLFWLRQAKSEHHCSIIANLKEEQMGKPWSWKSQAQNCSRTSQNPPRNRGRPTICLDLEAVLSKERKGHRNYCHHYKTFIFNFK